MPTKINLRGFTWTCRDVAAWLSICRVPLALFPAILWIGVVTLSGQSAQSCTTRGAAGGIWFPRRPATIDYK